jgi:hypothetical protein
VDQWVCIATKSSPFGPRWVNCTHYRAAASLSASPQLAESIRAAKRFRVVPKPAVSSRSKTVFLLDDLVGGHLHDQRHREAERLRRFEIDDEFDLRGLLHRKLGGLLTLEDAIDIEGRLAELVV